MLPRIETDATQRRGSPSWPRRALALTIDFVAVVIAPPIILAMLAFLVIGGDDDPATDDGAGAGALALVIWVPAAFGYFILSHGGGGSTLGERLLGIAVCGADGEPIGYGRAARRAMAWFNIVSFNPRRPWLPGGRGTDGSDQASDSIVVRTG